MIGDYGHIKRQVSRNFGNRRIQIESRISIFLCRLCNLLPSGLAFGGRCRSHLNKTAEVDGVVA